MSESAETQEAIAAVPWPPRYWWLKRLALSGALVLLAVVCLRVWWGAVAQRRLDAAIAAIVARGEPLYPEDFEQPSMPDDENGAIFYKEAVEAMWRPGGAITFVEATSDPSAYTDRLDEVGAIIRMNQRAIDLAREGALRQHAHWEDTDPRAANLSRTLSFFQYVNLARLLCAASVYYHYSADDQVAVELLTDVIQLSHAVSDNSQSLLASMTGQMIMGHVAAVCANLPSLFQESGLSGTRQPSSRRTSRQQIRGLIDELLDEQRMRSDMRRGFQAERAFQMDAVQRFLGGAPLSIVYGNSEAGTIERLSAMLRRLLYAPADRLDLVRMLGHMAGYVAQCGVADIPAARALQPSRPDYDTLLERRARNMSMWALPAFFDTWEGAARDWMRQALVGVMLAIRLYEMDHGGRPESLEMLVPEYLPRVPTDLMAADGRSVAYIGDGEQPRVYSVGVNARDDGGQTKNPTRAASRKRPAIPDDIIVYLNGKPGESAASQPSDAQRVENRDDVQRQPRNP